MNFETILNLEFVIILVSAVFFRYFMGTGDPMSFCQREPGSVARTVGSTPQKDNLTMPLSGLIAPESTVIEQEDIKLPPTGTGDSSDWDNLDGQEHVIQLFEPCADDFIKTQKDWVLIMFYIPSCAYSEFCKPEFTAAAKNLQVDPDCLLKSKKIKFAAINCEINKETCRKHSITGYPTILLFQNGQLVEEYDNPRHVDMFVAYGKNPPVGPFYASWFGGTS